MLGPTYSRTIEIGEGRTLLPSNSRIIVGYIHHRRDVEHEEYLEAVDLTSYVGTIPTGLASYILA